MANTNKKYYDTVYKTATQSGANAVQARQAAAEAVQKKYTVPTAAAPKTASGTLKLTVPTAAAPKTASGTLKNSTDPTASQRPAYTPSQSVTNAYSSMNTLLNNKPLPYKQSQAVADAYNNMTALDGKKPGAYQSKYSEQISALLNDIVNRGKFTYNAEDDPLYNQYKEQYTSMGQQAMQDTMGEAAALTGGYGSSYASTAGNQAYQAYLGQLNNKIPELYQLALDKYNNETNDMYSRMNLYQNLDDTDYGRHRDDVSDYYTDLNNAENRYNMLYNQDYGQHRDEVSDYYNDVSNSMNLYDMLYNQDYGQHRDNVGDWENDRSFAYNAAQDALSQQNWQKQFDYTKQQDKQSQSNWQAQFDYNKQQDKLSQDNWQKQFDRSNYENDRDYNRSVAESERDYQLSVSKLAAAKTSDNLVDGKEATKRVNDMFEAYDNVTGEKHYTPLDIAISVAEEYGGCDNFEEWSNSYKIPGSNYTMGDLLEEYYKERYGNSSSSLGSEGSYYANYLPHRNFTKAG